MPNGPRRNEDAEPLADVLAKFLKRSGIEERLEQSRVLEQWPALVGAEIAAVTRPLSVSEDGTLFVAVRTHAWMSELTMMERELLESVNRATGDRPIVRLRWSLMR
jgi:predicted nucleic acid-binding Zn ribbon protein